MAIIHTTLVNADLGVGLGLHNNDHVTRVLDDVEFPPPGGLPATIDAFRAALRDACHGPEVPGSAKASRPGSRHLFQTRLGIRNLRSGYASQVVGWPAFHDCLSDDDKKTFFGRTSMMIGGRLEPNASVLSTMMSLNAADRLLRRFVPQDGAWWPLKPVHWWTPRRVVEKILSGTTPDSLADTIRDRLGLYYDEFDAHGNAAAERANRRFLLHIPIALLKKNGHFRPNFADAGGYQRFAVQRSKRRAVKPAKWGMTTDLGALALQGRLQNGLQERVTPSFGRDDFIAHPIEFDYIGTLQTPRGNTPLDDDLAFERKLHAVHRTLLPGAQARLAALIVKLPRMTP